MRSTPIELDGTKQLRFDINSSRLATTSLQRYLPERAEKLKLTDAATLILQHDQDAIVIFLMAGLSYRDRSLSQRKVEDLMQAQIDKGGKIADFAMPIIEALEAAGLVEIQRKQASDEEETGDRPTPLRAVTDA